MRKCLLFLLSVCFLFISCSRYDLFPKEETPYHHGILKEIMDNMTINPTLSLAMIEDLSDTLDIKKLKKAEYYEYNTLLAEARYKCDYEFLNYIEIHQAVSYFDSLTELYPKNNELLFHNSRAHYYKGVAEEEKENYKEAFIFYLKSLSLLERIESHYNQNNEVIHFKALTYVRLSDILYWLDSYEAAIDCLNNANILFKLEDNYSSIIRNNILTAMIYGLSYNYEGTFKHLSIADSLLDIHDKDSEYKYVIERINATVMYNLGYREESFKTMLRQYKTLESQNLKMEAAGVLGDMYYSMGFLDSAIYYYEQYFPDNRYSQIDAANHIIEISLKTGNNELITKYAPALTNETRKEMALSKIKTELSSLYKQYTINKENHSAYKNIIFYLGITLSITLPFFILGMLLLQIKKGKYYNEINKKNFYINSLQDKFNKKISENKNIKKKLQNLENELIDIKTNKYLATASFDMKMKELIEKNELCQQLVEISHDESIKTNTEYPDLILSENKQKELINIFNAAFDKAFDRIVSEHERLKHNDILYFSLFLIGMNEKHISAVTGKTYNIIYNRIRKIKEIFGSDKSLKEIIRDNIIQLS